MTIFEAAAALLVFLAIGGTIDSQRAEKTAR